MYKKPNMKRSQLNIRETVEGETIETKMLRLTQNKENLSDGAPLIYQERKEGVEQGYNIRTDRWDVAIDAMTVVHKSAIAKRDYIPPTDEPQQSNEKNSLPE